MRRGLSAGRVQSVAMKMIVDREEAIKAFLPVEYWSFAARLSADNPPPFVAKLTKIDDKKAEVPNEELARKIEAALKTGKYVVERSRAEGKEAVRRPSVHHLDAPAHRLQPLQVAGEADDADGAEALRR